MYFSEQGNVDDDTTLITIFLFSFNLQSCCLMQSAVFSLQSAVCSLQSAVCCLQSAVCSLQSVVCSLQSANREFKIRRLRTTTTVKHATAHVQNHVTVHFSRVVLRLR